MGVIFPFGLIKMFWNYIDGVVSHIVYVINAPEIFTLNLCVNFTSIIINKKVKVKEIIHAKIIWKKAGVASWNSNFTQGLLQNKENYKGKRHALHVV